jgi:hypothetical protein
MTKPVSPATAGVLVRSGRRLPGPAGAGQPGWLHHNKKRSLNSRARMTNDELGDPLPSSFVIRISSFLERGAGDFAGIQK